MTYVALQRRPKAWSTDDWTWQSPPTIQAVEADPTPQDTGLLDQHGTPLYRVPETCKLGFVA